MAEAKREHDWQIASHQMAVLARCHGNKKATPADFNPLGKSGRTHARGTPIRADSVESLAKMLVDRRVGG